MAGRLPRMQLSERQRKYLRGLAHPLEPVILVGNAGLTEGVVKETARALHDHELVKVKIRGSDREARDAAFEALASLSREHIQDVEMMMAGAVLTILPVLLLFVALQRYYIQGLLLGSVKG